MGIYTSDLDDKQTAESELSSLLISTENKIPKVVIPQAFKEIGKEGKEKDREVVEKIFDDFAKSFTGWNMKSRMTKSKLV